VIDPVDDEIRRHMIVGQGVTVEPEPEPFTFRIGELGPKAELVARLWRDWPQERRDGVRGLSEHLHDAIEDLACLFYAKRRTGS
jgi:hypothetical protein